MNEACENYDRAPKIIQSSATHKLTCSPRLQMLHLIINLIHHHIPIHQLLTTLIHKVRTLGNTGQNYRMEVEGVVWAEERQDSLFVSVTISPLGDDAAECFFGMAGAVLDVGFLTP